MKQIIRDRNGVYHKLENDGHVTQRRAPHLDGTCTEHPECRAEQKKITVTSLGRIIEE